MIPLSIFIFANRILVFNRFNNSDKAVKETKNSAIGLITFYCML